MRRRLLTWAPMAGSMARMATTVLRGGTLFDGHRYVGEGALVVRDDRIALALTGPELGELDSWIDGVLDHVRVVDVAGGLIAPGFVDAHVHAVQGGLERLRCDLSGLATREDYLAAIASYAKAEP